MESVITLSLPINKNSSPLLATFGYVVLPYQRTFLNDLEECLCLNLLNYCLNPGRGGLVRQKDELNVLFWGKRGDIKLKYFRYLNLSVCCNFPIGTACFLLSI